MICSYRPLKKNLGAPGPGPAYENADIGHLSPISNLPCRSLQGLEQLQGRGVALAREAAQAELLVATDFVQAVRIAAGVSPQVEVLECGLCGD